MFLQKDDSQADYNSQKEQVSLKQTKVKLNSCLTIALCRNSKKKNSSYSTDTLKMLFPITGNTEIMKINP